ncbi:MAG: tRNA (adenosine(37)-N6)-threonylcarbamoyltransferase complex transferase subunit TsaD [Anaerolineae bacterium]|nr:tRNA (adenosine(37)-N6)-threonylcarbamoyltransferase complex transferase subunit TsaD [Anaerolineae bacterium]
MTLILGIESSCDETAAAVVADGRMILSNVVASQVELHRRYGGVFPEVASRQHVLSILPVVEQALDEAGLRWDGKRDPEPAAPGIDTAPQNALHLEAAPKNALHLEAAPQDALHLEAIAVAHGPGLAGSLLVGVNAAKGLALGRGLPLIGINHIEAHIYGNWLVPGPPPEFPLVCLVVSGGHTELVLMTGHGRYRRLGGTLDDAAGEAFDKVGRLLDLPYPGGPAIQEAARAGSPTAFKLPRAWLPGTYDFSFSGVKTAMLRTVHKYRPEAEERKHVGSNDAGTQPPPVVRALPVANLAASFQAAVVDVLAEKTVQAAVEFDAKMILLAGGVAANEALRREVRERSPIPTRYPPPSLCTDNAAIIASAGYFRFQAGDRAGWDLDVIPGLRLAEEVENTAP